MSEKRFYVETVAVREKVITDKEKFYSYEDLDEIVVLLNEQQAIIGQLQDLCGKSDYENAKLREEVNLLRPTNLEQYEQIQKLQEENEKLKNKLNSDL